MADTRYLITGLEELRRVAQELAQHLSGGDRVGLIGPLGAGKTTFTQALGQAFDITQPIESPTFVLRQAWPIVGHRAMNQLIHLDLYRLPDPDLTTLMELSLADDWADPRALILIEWADRSPDLLNRLTHQLVFVWDQQTNQRTITISRRGNDGK